MNIYITNENHRLTDVIVGNSFNFKSNINFRDLYDPISLFYYLRGKFPNKYKLQNQISNFKKVLLKYGVKIHDLDIINTNQIFAQAITLSIQANQDHADAVKQSSRPPFQEVISRLFVSEKINNCFRRSRYWGDNVLQIAVNGFSAISLPYGKLRVCLMWNSKRFQALFAHIFMVGLARLSINLGEPFGVVFLERLSFMLFQEIDGDDSCVIRLHFPES